MKFLLTLCCCFFLTQSFAQSEFITTWKTDNPGISEDNQITIPAYSGNFGEIKILWGDGTTNTYTNSSNLNHTYDIPGTYTVEISGNFPGFYFKNWGDNKKIVSVDQWGDIEWVAAQEAFSGCENLNVLANDGPNLSQVTSTNQMFRGCNTLVGTQGFNNWDVSTIVNMDSMFSDCTNFNAPIGNWDVSNVENMPAMFFNATSFNQNIGDWDVSKVKIMWAMFSGAHSFNQNISDWDVSNVTVMGWMFSNARAFNMPIGNWNVSNVTLMDLMFSNALLFNQDMSQWDVSNVSNMSRMFVNAKSFNQPIGNWDVSSVTNMGSMFANAESFNQPLNGWNISNVTNTSRMFYYAFNFRQDISSWDVSNVTDMSSMFNGATAFNRPLNTWNVSSVADMTRMFQYAYSFNQDISNWNVSNVTLMDNMFHRADAFKQDISSLNIEKVTSMADMFLEIRMSKIIYDRVLSSWSSLPQLQDGVVFNAGNSEYCYGNSGKEDLINNYNWNITDAGEVCFLPDQFVTKWKTDNVGSSADNQITIPTFPGETYNYTVDWGDGNVDINVTGNITHTYDIPGIYYVSISGSFPRIYFNETGDKDKILTINQWGSNQWTSMESAFAHCSNLSVAALDAPDLSSATSLNKMFFYCGYAFDNSGSREFSNFNGIPNFNDWDVSTIINMSHMFDKAAFYQDISQWNVSNVIDMSYMFFSCPFNFNISNWDTSNVQNMAGLFGASSFRKDVTGWDVSNVTNMDFLFNSTFFDQDISSWDVSNVTSMRHMLSQCSFNQDISTWNVSNVRDMSNIFDDNDLSRENYDKILIAWSQLPNLQYGTTLGAEDVQYCAGKEARQFLIDNYNWFFTDQGENCEEDRPFVSTWKTDNPGPSGDNQITIPTNPREVYNYSVDWGDGTTDTGITEDITHTYSQSGTYQVSITGRFPHMYFNNGAPTNFPHQQPSKISDTEKIISIDQWGTIRWNSMAYAFAGCSNMDILATDIPDLGKDIYLSGMFFGCTSLVGNQSMSLWDLSYTSFTARDMFSEASNFNQPIGNWDVSNLRYLNNMFKGATVFNQSLENWNIRSVQEMESMFDGSGLSVTNYDKILTAWSTIPFLVDNVKLGASDTYYCNSSTSRQLLIDNYGWEITDAGNDCSSTYFITTWKTDNPGVSAENRISIPIIRNTAGYNYNYSVNWGDGSIDTNVTSGISHTYQNPGTYQVAISGDFPAINFYSLSPEIGDEQKIIAVNQWGSQQWKSMQGAFYGCTNLDILATDVPDLSNVTSMRSMFHGCEILIGNNSFSNWDTSNVEDLAFLFSGTHKFNEDIGSWDVSKVRDMSGTFINAYSFNQNIGNWNVSNVEDMNGMFSRAFAFNHDIGKWDVSKVIRMGAMFFMAETFNQGIGNWNTQAVHEMDSMFNLALSFNRPIGKWKVSNVTGMNAMFRESNFDQDISEWDIQNVENLDHLFYLSEISQENYDLLLSAWSNLPNIKSNLVFNAGSSQFCNGEEGRQKLQSDFGWIIIDGGKVAFCNEDNDLDGVLDHKDNCLDTRPNVTVNNNGCEIIASDAILVYGTTPTCPEEANGSIAISSTLLDYTCNISIDGPVSSEFTNSSLNEPMEILNLSTGAYTITITIPDISYSQTYGIQINEVGSISGKRDYLDPNSKSASYTVEGSYSYKVNINGKDTLFNFDSTESNQIQLKNLYGFNTISISGESDCQGLIEDSFNFSDSVVMYPVNTKDKTFIEGYDKESEVQIFDISGRLLYQKKLQKDKLESIDLESYDSGIYPVNIISNKNTQTFKIIKQ